MDSQMIITIEEMGKAKVTHQGQWKINDEVTIDCYVTDKEYRLLSLRGTARAMNLIGGGSGALLRNLKSKWIQPYLSVQLEEWINGASNNKLPKISGVSGPAFIPFEATLFVDVCMAYSNARNDGILTKGQEDIAGRLLRVMSGFAKGGIIALVDEQTGYQEVRVKNAILEVINAFVSPELLPWQKRFPDTYYQELFRLNGWEYTSESIKKKPKIIGKWTRMLIYKALPKGVLEELEKNTPKNKSGKKTAKLHQSLTEDIGHPALTAQIYMVIGMFNSHRNMKEMLNSFNAKIARDSGQLEFKFDDNGHTIEEKDELIISKYNKNKAINFNSNKKPKDKKPTQLKFFE